MKGRSRTLQEARPTSPREPDRGAARRVVAERGIRTLDVESAHNPDIYPIMYETLVRAFDPLREGPIVEPSSRAR